MSGWWDDEARDAYELDDPKHPDFEDMSAEHADMERKRLKEQPLIDAAEEKA